MKKPLIVLSGPTAAGKSELSIRLAKDIGGEIISADSMQVYRGMDIGTAKLTKEKMQGVPHYLIDVLDPKEEFSVMKFKQMAEDALRVIYKKGKIPIIVGGTGFYIQSVVYDIEFKEHGGEKRKELENYAKEHGGMALYEMLIKKDPYTAGQIHPNNQKKVIRALEFFEETGTPLALHNEQQRERSSPYNFVYFVITCDRKKLYEKINDRVDIMMENGLLEEVRGFYENGINRNYISMEGLGYKQLLKFLEGKLSYDEAVEKIKLETRHFAKRQLTWFRREKEVIWLNKDELKSEDEQMEFIKNILLEKGIRG